MSFFSRIRKQKAVYWAPGIPTGIGGGTSWAAPVELDVRWDDRAEEFRDEAGNLQVSRAEVMVGSELAMGGWLWKGTLLTLPAGSSTDPRRAPGAGPIRYREATPNLKNTDTLRIVYL